MSGLLILVLLASGLFFQTGVVSASSKQSYSTKTLWVKNGIKTALVSPGSVDTELINTVGDEKIRANIIAAAKQDAALLKPEDIAASAVFIMSQPENVDINEILIRPRNQAL
ncbi:hypothetical protein IV38_GL001528 [Lactobacillus selangorensis]|uniref:Uncharacterized protein n=2 Tax=Lactobacillus selangorensis TaxID=81857 RepID=A0A0R2FII0_9LACO|nr:hypothetical protein IV38_GL001528 [Lactobacillus selangorensis]KRN31044.1 hypothetical protein IV40_GL001687 [Lactobacillus selangorensis]